MPRKTLTIFLLLLLAYPNNLKGQAVNDKPYLVLSTNTLQEKIVLNTDRTIYTINENIFFSAYCITNLNSLNFDWSTVLYLELIKPDGTPMEQTKLPFKHSGASGWIKIPENLLSGIYYLKAYTKWMRNFPTDSYAYTSLTIINAENAEVNASQTNTVAINNGGKSIETVTDLLINTDKLIYGKRDEVTVNIESNNLEYLNCNYCISVVKPELKALNNISLSNKSLSAVSDTARYLPEINGISLSGRVKNKNTDSLEENAIINLALLNNQSFFSGFKTNSDGEFYFAFPYSSHEYELFIKAEKDDLDLNIEIDDDFCTNPVHLPTSDFSMADLDISLVSEMSLNAQIANRFENVMRLDTNKLKISFYGTPTRVIYTKKYIDLPYLEEFLFELVPEVTVIYKDKVPSLHTKSRHTFSTFTFLVLVDNIPISDLAGFLKIKTNKIERIELIDNGYVSGKLKYSGIINAITINKDMAGVELPHNSMFFKYKMYAPQNHTTNLFNEDNKLDNRTPDRRNCLYWNPDFKFISGSKETFSFFTSDTKGEYKINIQSISKKDGSIRVSEKSFVVE